MEKALHEYFLPEYQFYLDEIQYKRLGDVVPSPQTALSCSDTVSAALKAENKVTVVLSREIKFDPEGIFSLLVRFGAELSLNTEVSKDVDWGTINLAEEFKDHGDFVISNLMSRSSLLVAEITASYGRQPLVLPGTIIR